MAGPHTARARARAQRLDEIKTQAWAQLATEGAAALSLRALARELDLVSSALYRYYPNRDALLTALIVDAYADLAQTLDRADQDLPAGDRRQRFTTRCLALRRWALAEPSRFLLIYGSPVPGYHAPQDTIRPSIEVVLAFLTVLEGSSSTAIGDPPPGEPLLTQLGQVAAGLSLNVPASLLARGVAAFAELIGMIVLELGGHLRGGFDPADALYAYAAAELTGRLGLSDGA